MAGAQQQLSRRHHYVPKFLLRPWAGEDGLMSGYRWNCSRNEVECKRRSPRRFCYEMDAWMLDEHELGRDTLERHRFSPLDNAGAKARDILLTDGPKALDEHGRRDFAKLLWSLEERQPSVVSQRRNTPTEIDNDKEIVALMDEYGFQGTPSEAYKEVTGKSLRDQVLTETLTDWSDNPRNVEALINMPRTVATVRGRAVSLILSDHPLLVPSGNIFPDVICVLPLNPQTIFIVSDRRVGLEGQLTSVAARKVNVWSAQQARKYVFSADDSHRRWLGKYLPRDSQSDGSTS